MQPFNNSRRLANKVYGARLGNVGPDDDWLYHGRGLAQIIGKANYVKVGLGGAPDKTSEMTTAIRILFDGIQKGIIAKKRADYDAADGYRYAATRATINGDVKANGAKIEKYGRAFETALRSAGYGAGKPTIPAEISQRFSM